MSDRNRVKAVLFSMGEDFGRPQVGSCAFPDHNLQHRRAAGGTKPGDHLRQVLAPLDAPRVGVAAGPGDFGERYLAGPRTGHPANGIVHAVVQDDMFEIRHARCRRRSPRHPCASASPHRRPEQTTCRPGCARAIPIAICEAWPIEPTVKNSRSWPISRAGATLVQFTRYFPSRRDMIASVSPRARRDRSRWPARESSRTGVRGLKAFGFVRLKGALAH